MLIERFKKQFMNDKVDEIIKRCKVELRNELGVEVDVLYRKKTNYKLDEIKQAVLISFSIEEYQFISKSRKTPLPLARQIFSWYSRNRTDAKLREIGAYINRHHSTIINNCDEINRMRGDEITEHYLRAVNEILDGKDAAKISGVIPEKPILTIERAPAIYSNKKWA